MLREHAGDVMTAETMDPATKFKALYPDEYAKLPADVRAYDEDDVEADPETTLGKFKKAVLKNAAVQAVVGNPHANPPVVAVAGVDAIPIETKLQLEKEVKAWLSGERAIYALITKACVKNSGMIIKTKGAGRAQVNFLKNYWNSNNKSGTRALDDSVRAFAYEKGEGIAVYKSSVPGGYLHDGPLWT